MFEMDEIFSIIENATMKLVLVVEADVEIGSLLVQAIKEKTSYQAFLVTNGIQALQITREVTPDLFVLDYRLPGMDGLELYELLNSMEGLESVPTILMSASSFFHQCDNEQHIFLDLQKLEQLKITPDLINELFGAIVLALAIAFGLAFGLGGQEAARRWLARGEGTVVTAASQISAQQSRDDARAAQLQADQMRAYQQAQAQTYQEQPTVQTQSQPPYAQQYPEADTPTGQAPYTRNNPRQ